MRTTLLVVAAGLLLTGCSGSLRSALGQTFDASLPGGSSVRQITSAGIVRRYLLHVPASYDPSTRTALIFNFHGYDVTTEEEESLSGMSAKADQAGFIVVYPEGLNKGWSDGPGPYGLHDLEFVRDLIGTLEGQYNIDPKRIYATGMSNGGGMANRVGCSMADLFAAIAPDAGAYNFWQDCNPTRPMPVLAFHGLEDALAPYAGGGIDTMEPPVEDWAAAWARRDGCNAGPAVTAPVQAVTVRTWSACQGNAEVVLYTLAGEGHSWPGSPTMPKEITSQAINATDIMWTFFKAHPMP